MSVDRIAPQRVRRPSGQRAQGRQCRTMEWHNARRRNVGPSPSCPHFSPLPKCHEDPYFKEKFDPRSVFERLVGRIYSAARFGLRTYHAEPKVRPLCPPPPPAGPHDSPKLTCAMRVRTRSCRSSRKASDYDLDHLGEAESGAGRTAPERAERGIFCPTTTCGNGF